MERIIIAYEPIWAIGTGKTATKEEANDAIKTIREEINKMYGQNIANECYNPIWWKRKIYQ